jgi:peptide subunit release factor 1 (eRF1)
MIDALNLSRTLAESSSENMIDLLKGYQEEMLSRGGEAVKRSRAAAGGQDSSRFAWGQPVRAGPELVN